MTDSPTALSVIVPACNEAGRIGACLDALLAADWAQARPPEVIVVVNGSTDATAVEAKARAQAFADRGWPFTLLERTEPGKPGALNAGDAAARAGNRLYLDADVLVSPGLLAELASALDMGAPRLVSGRLRITAPASWASRAYARAWAQVPFMASGVPACGLYAVNAAGRARWGAFPEIISDDTFVRLSFTPAERRALAAPYDWPVVPGLANLVRVRARQDRGVAEIRARYPERTRNDDPRSFPLARKLAVALRDPVGAAVYAGVALAAKLLPQPTGWSRGR